jgi:beta-galactosidase beta subunit
VHPLFPQAFDFLNSFDASTADGTYELQGSDLFAIVSRYSPVAADEKQWESHAVYGDIQAMLLLLLLLFLLPP